ncbi:TIGR03668 family PPOX class F420-dependent oxidoreductase [Mycobacterium montefiorense]|uniref:TIGR03668 family PPOX class F420-dependent oxidoreductase n=1 Tax=Mycobacterium montefiorense TaxID=154654 RepID=UPI0021DD676D|nr:TIGR03668 family PPOX class F420-dependent oxidoreductase [Mycobacterium montefiorense]MCV7429369.1 TIGR03668 family PPOX class F420-dependent oxidoreductase [Mycobacterium montefiorense]GLE54143.1 PPOX class F420-dependent oxidoreductase [Mycobacterium montefiorense]
MGEFDPKVRFTRSAVARLATSSPGGKPHLVPVVFAFDEDSPDGHEVVYTAIDAKPKSTQQLRRLANIAGNARVSLLVDHYADDWAQLWWVRVDGDASIHSNGEAMHTGYRLLRAKYPQYQSVSLNGPVIAIAVRRWSSWHA